MKKIFHLIAVTISLVLLVGCISNNLGDEKSMNLKIDGIEQITVSTQILPSFIFFICYFF